MYVGGHRRYPRKGGPAVKGKQWTLHKSQQGCIYAGIVIYFLATVPIARIGPSGRLCMSGLEEDTDFIPAKTVPAVG